jgi:hypothetical protein
MKKVLIAFTGVAFLAACNSTPKSGADIKITSDTTGLAAYNAWKAQGELIGNEGNVYYQYAPPGNIAEGRNSGNAAVTPKPSPKVRSTSNQGNGRNTSSTSQPPQATKKKGWSKAAKGTAIGAGSGAVIGAVVSKNKTKGAVIGGIIGAGGGYAIGRSMDKKDGRY